MLETVLNGGVRDLKQLSLRVRFPKRSCLVFGNGQSQDGSKVAVQSRAVVEHFVQRRLIAGAHEYEVRRLSASGRLDYHEESVTQVVGSLRRAEAEAVCPGLVLKIQRLADVRRKWTEIALGERALLQRRQRCIRGRRVDRGRQNER